jgi:hypothetical protein
VSQNKAGGKHAPDGKGYRRRRGDAMSSGRNIIRLRLLWFKDFILLLLFLARRFFL